MPDTTDLAGIKFQLRGRALVRFVTQAQKARETIARIEQDGSARREELKAAYTERDEAEKYIGILLTTAGLT